MFSQFIAVYLILKQYVSQFIATLYSVPKSTNYLIIGCSTGMGKALCFELVAKYKNIGIVLASRKEKELNILKSELLIINPNARIHVRPFDMTVYEDCKQLFIDSHSLLGNIDTVVINAGVFDLHHLDDADYFQKSQFMLNTNLFGPINLISEFAIYLKSNKIKNPYVVVVSSIASIIPYYNSTIYSTSKMCLEYFVKSVQISNPEITWTIIRPGYVYTKLTEWTKSIPLGITSKQAAQGMLSAMQCRSSFSTIPSFPWSIIMPLTHLVPTFILNTIIKHEFDYNVKDNLRAISKLRKHMYNTQSDYTIISEIGAGSYGTVYKALDNDTETIVALKKVIIESGDDDDILKEIEFMKSCKNEYLIQLINHYIHNNILFIAMEYCPAGSIADLMKYTEKTINQNQLGSVMRDVLRGLEYLHGRKAIHRDIKAGNLLITSAGTIKLCDFGASSNLTNSIVKRSTVIGTPYWMAPEIIKEVGYNTSADIWSLGITAIECLDGHPPHHKVHPMRAIFMIPNKPAPCSVNADFQSRECVGFVAECLKKNPDDRPTATALLKHEYIVNAPAASILVELVALSIEVSGKKRELEQQQAQQESMIKSVNASKQESIVTGTTVITEQVSGTMVVNEDELNTMRQTTEAA